jgi:hypothetical protein
MARRPRAVRWGNAIRTLWARSRPTGEVGLAIGWTRCWRPYCGRALLPPDQVAATVRAATPDVNSKPSIVGAGGAARPYEREIVGSRAPRHGTTAPSASTTHISCGPVEFSHRPLVERLVSHDRIPRDRVEPLVAEFEQEAESRSLDPLSVDYWRGCRTGFASA